MTKIVAGPRNQSVSSCNEQPAACGLFVARVFPDEVRRVNGEEHPRAKALTGFGGRSVLEVVDDEDGDTCRAVHPRQQTGGIHAEHYSSGKTFSIEQIALIEPFESEAATPSRALFGFACISAVRAFASASYVGRASRAA